MRNQRYARKEANCGAASSQRCAGPKSTGSLHRM